MSANVVHISQTPGERAGWIRVENGLAGKKKSSIDRNAALPMSPKSSGRMGC